MTVGYDSYEAKVVQAVIAMLSEHGGDRFDVARIERTFKGALDRHGFRAGVEGGRSVAELCAPWDRERDAFLKRRAPFLLY